MKLTDILEDLDDNTIEDICEYLYEKDKDNSTGEDLREHLIAYSIMYHQWRSLKEAMLVKDEFIKGYLEKQGYNVEY